jgi:hypothetical protein
MKEGNQMVVKGDSPGLIASHCLTNNFWAEIHLRSMCYVNSISHLISYVIF